VTLQVFVQNTNDDCHDARATRAPQLSARYARSTIAARYARSTIAAQLPALHNWRANRAPQLAR
jgi:hypothetical protein